MNKQERKEIVGWVFELIHDGVVMLLLIAIFFIGFCLV